MPGSTNGWPSGPTSVSNRDYPVVQGVTLLFALLIVLINLLSDVTQAALDPRVGQEIGE
jgi:ABC-type dipeptide/oligopeptide/nickel transport system permease component